MFDKIQMISQLNYNKMILMIKFREFITILIKSSSNGKAKRSLKIKTITKFKVVIIASGSP